MCFHSRVIKFWIFVTIPKRYKSWMKAYFSMKFETWKLKWNNSLEFKFQVSHYWHLYGYSLIVKDLIDTLGLWKKLYHAAFSERFSMKIELRIHWWWYINVLFSLIVNYSECLRIRHTNYTSFFIQNTNGLIMHQRQRGISRWTWTNRFDIGPTFTIIGADM